MLLPSSLPCYASQASQASPLSRHQHHQPGYIPSPPDTPQVSSSHNALGNIMNTCRSLQSLISMAPSPYDYPAPILAPLGMPQLPTPPLMHTPTPIKLRLRPHASRSDSSRPDESPCASARRRVVKRTAPRGPVKRRRVDEANDLARHCDYELEPPSSLDSEYECEQELLPSDLPLPPAPSTPKRSRIAPSFLPLGLERSDFHDLDILQGGARPSDAEKPGTGIVTEPDGSEWSIEDDRVLVELVMEKLKLSKEAWLDCAKSLGKDRHVVTRRWRSLVTNGDVGLKARSGRRPSLFSTWR